MLNNAGNANWLSFLGGANCCLQCTLYVVFLPHSEKQFRLKRGYVMQLLVTEGRSVDQERFSHNMVRVFVNNDLSYGYWVEEEFLFSLLSQEQQEQYLSDQSYSGGFFDIGTDVARKIVEAGITPFSKQTI